MTKIDVETFDRILREAVNDAFPSACQVLTVPGVYELLAEEFNNEVLDRWRDEQETERDLEDQG